MKYLVFLSAMMLVSPLAAQNECLRTRFNTSIDNTSHANTYHLFKQLFDHFGLQNTYKATKKSSKNYIRASGKNSYKDPWLELYDDELQTGIRITWDKQFEYRFYRFKILRDQPYLLLPWCTELDFKTKPIEPIITKYDTYDLTKLVGFSMSNSDLEALRANSSLKEISPLVFSNTDGTLKLEFNRDGGINLNSIIVKLKLINIKLPKDISASSNLDDLEKAFGIPYGFDGTNFEVIFGAFEPTKENPRFLANFVLNEEQSSIISFSLKSLGSIRTSIGTLNDYELDQEQRQGCIGCTNGAGSYKKFYFSNGYSFYGEVRNDRPYEGQVYGHAPLPNNGNYSLPEILEKERLANRTDAEIIADDVAAKVQFAKARIAERNKEASDQLTEYIKNMKENLNSINYNYAEFIKKMNDGYNLKESYRYVKNAAAMVHFDLIRQRAKELQNQVDILREFIKMGQHCSGSNTKLNEIDQQGSKIIDFYEKTFKALWKPSRPTAQRYIYNFPEDQLENFLHENIDEMKTTYEISRQFIFDFQDIYVGCR